MLITFYFVNYYKLYYNDSKNYANFEIMLWNYKGSNNFGHAMQRIKTSIITPSRRKSGNWKKKGYRFGGTVIV